MKKQLGHVSRMASAFRDWISGTDSSTDSKRGLEKNGAMNSETVEVLVRQRLVLGNALA
jgi:hypothetical protein